MITISVTCSARAERPDELSAALVFSLIFVLTLKRLALRQCGNLLSIPLLISGLSRDPVTGFLHETLLEEEGISTDIGKSNVESLSISDTTSCADGKVTMLMSCFKSLRVFHCVLGVPAEALGEWAADPSIYSDISSPQRSSLEEIHLGICTQPKTTNGTLGTSLRRFPNLKTISLPRSFLVRLPGKRRYGYVDEDEPESNATFADLYLALPSALETLVLCIDEDTSYCHTDVQLPRVELVRCLRDVAVHKERLYRHFERLILWSN